MAALTYDRWLTTDGPTGRLFKLAAGTTINSYYSIMFWEAVLTAAVIAVAVIYALHFYARALSTQITDLSERLARLEEVGRQHSEVLDVIKYQTESDSDRELREWGRMVDVTLQYVQSLKPGKCIELVSRSYEYPYDRGLSQSFHFCFERLERSSEDPAQYRVVGKERFDALEQWRESSFWVDERQAQVSSGGGTIRRHVTPDEILAAARARQNNRS